MILFISGVIAGILAFYLLSDVKAGLWEWALVIAGFFMVILGFEIFILSCAEHEGRAAWLGFLLCNAAAAVLFFFAYRRGFRIPGYRFIHLAGIVKNAALSVSSRARGSVHVVRNRIHSKVQRSRS